MAVNKEKWAALNLRLPRDLKAKLDIEAADAGNSLNSTIVNLLNLLLRHTK